MSEYCGRILRLTSNRVWRTYSGGLMLDRMEELAGPADGPFPEDWLGSTVRAINPDRERGNEGLSQVMVNGQARLLADLIEADPEYFLGSAHVARFGTNPMVLVKYLDAAVRLPFQVHPTVQFSRRYLNSSSGKTEAYYILSTRPEVAEPFIYLGFQRPPSREELRRMIVEQDIDAMERCFDKISVKPGDIYVVPGGLPHAIGGGVLMVEVMEPTDFVARVEFSVGGRTIPEPARFMGRDIEFVLDMFSFDAWPVGQVQERWKRAPRVLEQSSTMYRESVVDERLTDRFRMARSIVIGRSVWHPRGFTVLLVAEGSCTVETADEEIPLRTFDRVVVPHGLESMQIRATDRAVLLECNPPSVAQ
jgi:mannose-6-phosphate isomerase